MTFRSSVTWDVEQGTKPGGVDFVLTFTPPRWQFWRRAYSERLTLSVKDALDLYQAIHKFAAARWGT